MNFPTQLLKEWFLLNRRELPWRDNPTPYRVWISEMMLQQTQVSVVIPYFEKWMKEFPTIEILAKTPLEKILKCWEGLGYYSRPRYLQKAAIYLMAHHEGELPSSTEQLKKIPGIGPYTLGAIQSFAFQQKSVAVDGNVMRLLSRFSGEEGEIDRSSAKKRLLRLAESILPDDQPWIIVEALIELGALVCAKKAKCSQCPLRGSCVAYQHHLQDILPKKKNKKEVIHLIRHVAVIQCGEKFLIEKRESGNVMADLYEFPYLEEAEALQMRCEKKYNLKLTFQSTLDTQWHTFTKYRVQLLPVLFYAESIANPYLWKSTAELLELPFSAGHKKILNRL